MRVVPVKVRPGFSLVEVLAYCACLSLFVLAVAAVLILGRSCYLQAQSQSEATRNAQVAADLMDTWIATGCSAAIQAQNGAVPAVIVLSAKAPTLAFQTDSGGNLKWFRWVCFWLDTNTSSRTYRCLMLSTQDLGAPTTRIPPPPGGSWPAAFTAMTGAPSRVVARGVQGLSFEPTPNPKSYILQLATLSDAGTTIMGRLVVRN